MDTLAAVYRRLRDHIRSVRGDAVMSANAQPFRSFSAPWRQSTDMVELLGVLDLVIDQSANYPAYADGRLRSRIRDLKLARELKTTVVALCDSDSMLTPDQERHFLLPLYEDLVFGGVPTDRTIMNPTPVEGFIDRDRLARRRPLHAKFNALVREKRTLFTAPAWQPIRLFYPVKELQLSRQASSGLCAAEEILIRRHLPWGYLVSTPERPLDVPADTEVIVAADQVALSEAETAALVAWAKKGGKLVVTGDSGRYDALNAQYLVNPFLPRLKGLTNVALRAKADQVSPCTLAWEYKVGAPADHGAALADDLAKVGFRLPFAIENCPETTAVDVRRLKDGFVFHFVNYDPARPVKGVTVRLADGRTAAAPEIVEYAQVVFGRNETFMLR